LCPPSADEVLIYVGGFNNEKPASRTNMVIFVPLYQRANAKSERAQAEIIQYSSIAHAHLISDFSYMITQFVHKSLGV
jgi:hypothetical protein